MRAQSTVRCVEVARICIWSVDLPVLLDHHARLISDVEAVLAQGERNTFAYGTQTSTLLHELPGKHWSIFFSEVRGAISQVLAASEGRIDEGTVHLRAWASILGKKERRLEEQQLNLRGLHNHAPAFLSAVYFLQLPDASGAGGTFFVNPACHPITSPHPGIAVTPAEGRLVLFPSTLMHAPFSSGTTSERTRITIAVDAHLIPS